MNPEHERDTRLAAKFISALQCRTNQASVKGFAMQFGPGFDIDDIPWSVVERARDNLIKALHNKELTTIPGLMRAHMKPFDIAPSDAPPVYQSKSKSMVEQNKKYVKISTSEAPHVSRVEKELLAALDRKIEPRLLFFGNRAFCELQNEAGVSEKVYLDVTRPCMVAAQLLLDYECAKPGPETEAQKLEVHAEVTKTHLNRVTRVDHILCCLDTKRTGPNLTVIEYKAPKKINHNQWKTAVDKGEVQKVNSLPASVKPWFSQLLDYSVTHDPYNSYAVDAVEYIPVTWLPHNPSGPGGNGGLSQSQGIDAVEPLKAVTFNTHRDESDRRNQQTYLQARRQGDPVVPVHMSLLKLFTDGLEKYGFKVRTGW